MLGLAADGYLGVMDRPALRASDADRERTAGRLRHACAEGRITADELDERLAAAWGAREVAELERLVVDLPLPAPAPPPPPGRGLSLAGRDALEHAAVQAGVALAIAVIVWVATGADGDFWPRWVALFAVIRVLLAVPSARRPR
jgi:hypothetical protein